MIRVSKPHMEEENSKIKIIEVIPITKGITKERLTYFTSIDIPLGSIVNVPLRKKTVSALVVEMRDASDLKSEIKNSPFVIKKAQKLKSERLFSPEFIESCEQTAEYFATTTGAVLNSMVPNAIWESLGKLKIPNAFAPNQNSHEKLVLQAEDDERFANYKSLIREEFARKSSVFFCLPTIGDIKNAESLLIKGIEKYTFVLHSLMKKSEVIEIWNKIAKEEHPVLIIATGPYLCIPRSDLGTIVLERENSRSFKMQTRPYLDIRNFAEFYAKKIKVKLLMGDNLLRTETIWRQKNDECAEFAPLKARSLSTAEEKLVNIKKNSNPKEFKIISDELGELIKRTKENSENLFIFAARRGMFPTTICGDCGFVVKCSACSSPVILHNTDGKENFFLCHRCGERRSSSEKCKNCDSWRLNTLGIGVERIEKELEENYPSVKVFRLDKDSADSHKKALEIISKFNSTPGSILLGTEMALVFLNKKIDNTAVASIDSMFSIPDFRINEKILYLLLKVRSLAQRNFLLQTRNTEVELLDYALRGNLADFYREEIEQRKAFNYPPFSVLIKITLKGEKKVIETEAKELKNYFLPYQSDIFPGFVSQIKNMHIIHMLIKVPKNEWVEKELLGKLLLLPRQYSVNIDPESIL